MYVHSHQAKQIDVRTNLIHCPGVTRWHWNSYLNVYNREHAELYSLFLLSASKAYHVSSIPPWVRKEVQADRFIKRSAAYAYFQYDFSSSCHYDRRPNDDLRYHWRYYLLPDSSRFIRDISEESGEEILLSALSTANKLHCPSNQTRTALSICCQGTEK